MGEKSEKIIAAVGRYLVEDMSYYRNTYHIVFRTKYSQCTIFEESERDLYAYILGFCNNSKCKLYRIGGMPDHIHMLVDIPPTVALSSFMNKLKSETSKWLKQNHNFPMFSGWGEGYACFTYAFDDLDTVKNYIRNQKEHHRVETFANEYRRLIESQGINIDERFFLND